MKLYNIYKIIKMNKQKKINIIMIFKNMFKKFIQKNKFD